MKRLALLVLCAVFLVGIISASLVSAQAGWNCMYGNAGDDVAYSAVQAANDGFAVAGSTNSSDTGSLDGWLVKIDSSGKMQWNKTYGGNKNDVFHSVICTSDGQYAMAGYTASYGADALDFWLVKVDSSGNMLWNKTFGETGNDEAWCLIQASDGGYVLTGTTNSSGKTDFWLVKTDSSGNMQWNKKYGGTGDEVAKCVIQTRNDGYSLAGYKRAYNATAFNMWIVKTDSSGNAQWNQIFGGSGHSGAFSVMQTSDQGYALVGATVSCSANKSDAWLIKLGKTGSMEWNQTYGSKMQDAACSFIQTSDGGYALAGITESFGAGGQDCWVVKTDASGNIQWNQTYGGSKSDGVYSLFQTGDGGFVLVGYSESNSNGGKDFLVIKTDASGAVPEFSAPLIMVLLALVSFAALTYKRSILHSGKRFSNV